MSNPVEDFCEWVRSNSNNLASILNNLGDQGTYSDIGTSDSLVNQTQIPINGLQVFVLVLATALAGMMLQSKLCTKRDTMCFR